MFWLSVYNTYCNDKEKGIGNFSTGYTKTNGTTGDPRYAVCAFLDKVVRKGLFQIRLTFLYKFYSSKTGFDFYFNGTATAFA